MNHILYLTQRRKDAKEERNRKISVWYKYMKTAVKKALIGRLGCGTWTYPCGTLRERGAISMKPNMSVGLRCRLTQPTKNGKGIE